MPPGRGLDGVDSATSPAGAPGFTELPSWSWYPRSGGCQTEARVIDLGADGPLPDRAACAGLLDRIMEGVPSIHGLAVNSTRVYAATNADVRVTGREGGMDRVVVNRPTWRILVDDDQLFWSDGSPELNELREDREPRSSRLPVAASTVSLKTTTLSTASLASPWCAYRRRRKPSGRWSKPRP